MDTLTEELPLANETAQPAQVERFWSWLMIVTIAFGASVFDQIHAWWDGAHLAALGRQEVYFQFVPFHVHLILLLAVFVYVIYRQGRRLAEFGISIDRRDVLDGALMLLVFLTLTVGVAGPYVNTTALGATQAFSPKWIWSLSAALSGLTNGGLLTGEVFLLTAVTSALVGLAYTMTEVESFSGSKLIAIFASFAFQFVALNRGPLPVRLIMSTMIVVFIVYYLFRRRLIPVVLCYCGYLAVGIVGTIAYAVLWKTR
jgi:hypothetical protein